MPAAQDPLLRLDDVSLAFGSLHLLDHASLQVEPGERVCIVGRNGAGKSSLLRLVRGQALPDSGRVWVRPGARIAALAQDIDDIADQDVASVVAGGLPEIAALLSEWHRVTQAYGDILTSERMVAKHRTSDLAGPRIQCCMAFAVLGAAENAAGKRGLSINKSNG